MITRYTLYYDRFDLRLWSSKALPVYDLFSHWIVVFLSDPHFLELFNLWKDCSTEPARILSVCWSFDAGCHVGRCKCGNLFTHSFLHSLEHSATTSEHNILEEVSLDVWLTLEDGIECVLLEAIFSWLVLETWLEKHFWDTNELFANGDCVSIGKFVLNWSSVSFVGWLKFSIIVRSNARIFDLENFCFG